MHEAGNGYGILFHKGEPICGEWATHGEPTVLGLYELDQKCPWHKIVEVNALSCVEINRLMHENNVLT